MAPGPHRSCHRLHPDRLYITTKRRQWHCTALPKDRSRDISIAVREHQLTKAAEPLACKLAPTIEKEDRGIAVLFADLLSGAKYLERSEVEARLANIKQLINRCDLYVRLTFSNETSAALRRLSDLDHDKIEQARRVSNHRHQRRIAAEPVARELRPQVEDTHERVAQRLAGEKYLRRSVADAIVTSSSMSSRTSRRIAWP